jgi:hypothetical protein
MPQVISGQAGKDPSSDWIQTGNKSKERVNPDREKTQAGNGSKQGEKE